MESQVILLCVLANNSCNHLVCSKPLPFMKDRPVVFAEYHALVWPCLAKSNPEKRGATLQQLAHNTHGTVIKIYERTPATCCL